MFEKMLSNLKIQTKVVLVLVPFTASIIGVVGTGLYASGKFQRRLDISSDVLSSLGGFKEVYAGISGFLLDPSQGNYDKAKQTIGDQLSVLDQTAKNLGVSADTQAVDQAVTDTYAIASRLDALWGLKNDRDGLISSIESSSKSLLDLQAEAGKHAFKLMGTAKSKQIAIKRRVANIMRASELVKMISDARTQGSPAASARGQRVSIV